MKLNGRQLEVPRDVRVFNLEAVLYGPPLEPFGRDAAGGNSRTAPKGLELGLRNHTVFIHLDQANKEII